jgi:D-serine deaminase-like pyridoxal phosphate-dependent protein
MATLETFSTPVVVIDRSRLLANIRQMQAACDAHGIELRPHIKTHKMTAIAREQLAAGARGLTCAKLGEAEVMLPSGVRELFVAHSLVDPAQAPRVATLAERLHELRVGLTSTAHLEPLSRLAARAGRKLSVMMAVDTGLGREGVRSDAEAKGLAAQLARHPHLELRGLYCHEGHFYGLAPEQAAAATEQMIDRMDRLRHAIDPHLALWPGCSVTARQIVGRSLGRVQAVRPGLMCSATCT